MSRSFLKFVLSVFIVAGIATASYAQDEANMARPNTKAGSAAWMFEIAGLGAFGMGGLPIGTLSASGNEGVTGISTTVVGAGWKWYFADDMALRALLGFNTNSTGNADSAGGKQSNTNWGIAVGVELHTHPVYSTSPYFGAQVSFASGSSDHNMTAIGEDKTSASAFGLGVIAGFDWYFTRGIAIGGEYMLGFTTTSSSTTSTPKGGTASTHDNPSGLNIGISSANVHLVVHF